MVISFQTLFFISFTCTLTQGNADCFIVISVWPFNKQFVWISFGVYLFKINLNVYLNRGLFKVSYLKMHFIQYCIIFNDRTIAILKLRENEHFVAEACQTNLGIVYSYAVQLIFESRYSFLLHYKASFWIRREWRVTSLWRSNTYKTAWQCY